MDHHTRFTAKMPEVMRLISRGITCSQVTSQNGVWVHTVTSLNKCAYRKLNVQAAATALMRAVQLWFFGEGGSSSPKVQSGSDKTTNWMTRLRIAALAPLVLALSSCGGGGGDGDGDSGNGGPCSPAPQITSVPPTVATVGERYSYKPQGTYVCGLLVIFPETCTDIEEVWFTPGAADANRNIPFFVSTPPDICGAQATQSWTVHVQPGAPVADRLPPPVIESFVASSETIASGASVLLTAVFQGSGVISGIGPVSSGVSVATPALNTTTQFALIVGNGDGPEARITLQVDVVGPPTIQSLSASPAAIGIGGSSTLRWSVGGSISTARLDPPGIDVMGAASIVVTPEVTTTYVLNLANELGETVSASVQVEVAPPTFIESFSATPAVSTPGGTVILAARFQGSGTLEREDNGFYTTIGPIASGATISSGELLRSTDFRLRVTNAAGMVVTQNLAVPVIGPGTFQPARGQPIAPLRVRHTATRLADGRVFIAGGQAPVGGETNTTELYDPATETFTAGPNLIEARFLHSATLLADGRVLIAGGTGIGFQNERLTVEIFDPAKGSVRSVARLPGPAQFFPSQALSLPDGRVAIESSMSGTPSVRGVAIFDPSNDSLGEFILFANPYSGVQSVERLPDGRGLFIRGNNQSEIFQPGSNSFAFTAAATNPRGIDFATAVLGDGRVLLTGGTVDPSTPAEVYDPVTGTFEVVGVQRFFARRYGRAVTLASGKTLVVGGGDVQLGTPWAELFDPVAGTFSATGGLRTGRWSHTATLLDDGRVLVVGGCSGLPCDAELYKP